MCVLPLSLVWGRAEGAKITRRIGEKRRIVLWLLWLSPPVCKRHQRNNFWGNFFGYFWDGGKKKWTIRFPVKRGGRGKRSSSTQTQCCQSHGRAPLPKGRIVQSTRTHHAFPSFLTEKKRVSSEGILSSFFWPYQMERKLDWKRKKPLPFLGGGVGKTERGKKKLLSSTKKSSKSDLVKLFRLFSFWGGFQCIWHPSSSFFKGIWQSDHKKVLKKRRKGGGRNGGLTRPLCPSPPSPSSKAKNRNPPPLPLLQPKSQKDGADFL